MDVFTTVMSSQHKELSQMQSKDNQHQILTGHATKLRSKFLRRRHKQMKTNFLPSSEQEQNKVLERMSPEYKYEDNGNTDGHENHISSLLDEKTIQSLTSKHLLDSGSQQSTRAMPALSIMKELKHVGNHPSGQSLEQLNIMLQNTLPEYQYDRAERGPEFSYDGCVDLDPDCWKYEMHGWCSDSPDLAEKRFNCKKTCHLCLSSAGARSHTRKEMRKM